MIRLTGLILFLFMAINAIGQPTERFADLSDSLVKEELSGFVRASGLPITANRKQPLKQIKLSRCATDFVTFESGDWIALDKLVSISSSSASPGKISAIRYLHYKFEIILPDSAFSALNHPRYCVNPGKKNKIRKSTTTDCRVFESIDKKRVYIYMLNGEGADQYEVTWVIKDSKYYMRILDTLTNGQ